MYIVYYDETGDDGYPRYSSALFVLTAVYVHYLSWKDVHNTIVEFRKQLKDDFGLPVKMEFHSKYFILNKKPYRGFNLSDSDRLLIVDLFCNFIGQLDIKIINVVINKPAICLFRLNSYQSFRLKSYQFTKDWRRYEREEST